MSVESVIWILTLLSLGNAESLIVETNYGPVKGFRYESEKGNEANIFLGIPFAKPPVGELRFEKSEKPEKWTEILETVEYASACFPHHPSGMFYGNNFKEDCLYLNVMTPVKNKDGGRAVMVWIHGGGYNLGSALEFSYKNITDNFVSRDVVVVTIQYRLGPLGFLSSGDSVMPGNLGFWDQTAALEFVSENIAFFGGDRSRITIFGLSAGGGSTSALTLSPYSRSLFTNSIEMSGSVFAEWSSSDLVVDASHKLAQALNCDIENSVELKKCMKTKTVDEIFDGVDKTGKMRATSVRAIKYGPRLDDDFFPKDFEALIKQKPNKPSVIGTTEKEGILFTLFDIGGGISGMNILPEDFESYNREKLINFIKTDTAPEAVFGDQTEEVRQKLINYYADSKDSEGKDHKYWLEKYTLLVSDLMFNIPSLREAELKIQNDWPVWLYLTDYFYPGHFKEDFPVKGASHGSEQLLMFGNLLTNGTTVFTEEEIKLQKALLDSFTNFAKHGNPSTNDFKWDLATKESPLQNLRFRPEPIMEKTMFKASNNFWKTMENYDYDIIARRTRAKSSKTFRSEL